MLFFPEMFMSLTDPKAGIMFRTASTMVTAVVRFRDDVSHNMHGYKIVIMSDNYRVLELNLLHISLI